MFSNLKNNIIKKSFRFKKRRFHAYCIGSAKTGTTSVANCLSSVCSSAHEAEVVSTNRLIIDKIENLRSDTLVRTALIKRDKRLNLEIEASHPLSYLSQELVEIFPDAKFIVTIREPYSWLSSRLNFHYKKKPAQWEEYREYFWIQKNKGYEPEEEVLIKYNLCSLDTYLKQYTEQYKLIFNCIPKDKMLLIRTDELNTSIDAIKNFLGFEQAIALEMPTSNKESNKISVLSEINNDFVKKKTWENCQELIENYFPETISFYSTNSK